MSEPETDEEYSFPVVSAELLAALELFAPEVNPPDTKAETNDLWRAIGMRQVVLFLKWQKKLQDEARLNRNRE